MLAAGQEALECRRVLQKGGLNLVGEVLRGQGTFYEYAHYPDDDVYDQDSRAQYYYHAHRAGEHGHFHTFLRVSTAKRESSPAGNGPDSGEPVHLIAISMDAYGWPIGLFATNHWVCGGAWLLAEKVIALLPRFRIDHAYPSWPVNRWIGAMMVLFRPHIEALLIHRDAAIGAWARAHSESDAFEDRELGVTGYLPISVEGLTREVGALAGVRRRG